MNAKWVLFDQVINEFDHTFLDVALVYSQSPDSCGIFDCIVYEDNLLLSIEKIAQCVSDGLVLLHEKEETAYIAAEVFQMGQKRRK